MRSCTSRVRGSESASSLREIRDECCCLQEMEAPSAGDSVPDPCFDFEDRGREEPERSRVLGMRGAGVESPWSRGMAGARLSWERGVRWRWRSEPLSWRSACDVWGVEGAWPRVGASSSSSSRPTPLPDFLRVVGRPNSRKLAGGVLEAM